MQLVTGGLGGLGLQAATALVDSGAQSLLLVSRRGHVAQGDEMSKGNLEALQSLDITVGTCACDVAQTDAVADLLVHNCVGGIVHAAGVIDFVELKAVGPGPFFSVSRCLKL